MADADMHKYAHHACCCATPCTCKCTSHLFCTLFARVNAQHMVWCACAYVCNIWIYACCYLHHLFWCIRRGVLATTLRRALFTGPSLSNSHAGPSPSGRTVIMISEAPTTRDGDRKCKSNHVCVKIVWLPDWLSVLSRANAMIIAKSDEKKTTEINMGMSPRTHWSE